MLDVIAVLRKLSDADPVWTEADTRANAIDPLIEALGWTSGCVSREPYAGWKDHRGYIDYLLIVGGLPYFVIEAKRVGRTFDLPEELRKRGNTTLDKLRSVANDDLREAIEQCIRYCNHSGATLACATNGRDFLFFRPVLPGRAQGEAKVVIFTEPSGILTRLDEFQRLFLRRNVELGHADRALSGRETFVPQFAKRLEQTIPFRAPADIETQDYSAIVDRFVREFLIEVPDDEVFRRCYVPVGWTRSTDDALEVMLQNHVASFARLRRSADLELPLPPLADQRLRVITDGRPHGRMVILHGPVGVGKTSYLRHFAGRIDRRSMIWAHLDLIPYRDTQFTEDAAKELTRRLSDDLRSRIVEATTEVRKDADPDEFRHLRDIYNREAREFQKGRFPSSDDTDGVYLEELRKHIWDLKTRDPHDHLVRVLHWLTIKLQIPAVVVLDNSDQLGLEFQEFLYKLGSAIQRNTSSIVVICLRTQALLSHRIRKHAIAEIEERYEVERAPLLDVIARRFAVMEAELRAQEKVEKNTHVTIALDRLHVLLEALNRDFVTGGQAARVVDTIGNNNLRRSLEALSHVFRFKPSEMDRLVFEDATKGMARLDPGFVLRAIMRAGRGRYRSDMPRNLVPNVFTVDGGVLQSHGLIVRILRHLRAKTRPEDAPTAGATIRAFACAGVDNTVMEKALAKLLHEEMITIPQFADHVEEDDPIRITRLGAGMLEDIVHSRAYLESILWDTLIYDETVYNSMAHAWRSEKDVRRRYEAMRRIFIEYLQSDEGEAQRAMQLQFLDPAARIPLDLSALI